MHASWFKVINVFIKIAIAILLIYLLYNQLHVSDLSLSDSLHSIWLTIQKLNFWYLFLIILLMPINWFLESLRFKALLSPVFDISLSLSIRCVCSGLSLAAITPNRIGEYAGRIIPLRSKDNVQGLISTFIGSLAQNVVNIGLGALGGTVVLWYWLDLNMLQICLALACILVFLVMMVYLYFHLTLISRLLVWLRTYAIFERWLPKLTSLNYFDQKLLTKALAYSILRYLIYSAQYILVIYAFQFDIEWYWIISGVACIYLLQTGLPIPPLLGILARAEIAILIWGIFVADHGAIVMATLLLWIINIILPSLVGLFFVSKENILQSLGIKNRHYHPS